MKSALLKKTIGILVVLVSLAASASGQENHYVYTDGLMKDTSAKGWIKEFLNRQKSGMTGNPDALSYPYNTCLWDGEIARNRNYGRDWWRYEQTAYYTDGLLRLGYILDDRELVDKGEAGIIYTLKNKESNGRLAHGSFSHATMWPMCIFFRAIQAYYDENNDSGIPEALEKHYLSYSMEDLQNWRNIVSLEGMLWTYGLTRNKELLDRSVSAWNNGKFGDLTPKACAGDTIPKMHGVTFCEELKLPVLLYAHTGDKRYLELAKHAYDNMERDYMLPDGVNTSAEHLLKNDNIIISHETCDIADLSWTLGYFLMATGDAGWADKIERIVFNAAPGAVTKDFRSLQYFSSVNQVIATGYSNHNEYFHGSTWMAYRPIHQTECCSGNVHRIMPNYVSRMWMKDKKGKIAATLYGPSEIELELGDGSTCRIEEVTSYPFDDEINFIFHPEKSSRIPFTFRIPGWSRHTEISINGKKMKNNTESGSFFTLDRIFKDGDTVTVDFCMEPEVVHIENQGAYIQMGPVVYSYPVPQKVKEDTTQYENMFGKSADNENFKCWEISPDGSWNYALYKPSISDFEIQISDPDKYPFDDDGVNMKVKVPVKKIDWTLEDNKFTPELPEPDKIKVLHDNVEYIDLVPYGSTELRITVFPVLNQ